MNWCLVRIALVTCALVLCIGEVDSSEDHSYQVESVEHDLETDQDDYYNEEDEERRKHHYHHHGHGSHHHGTHYVTTQKPKPAATTEKGPVALPNPKPKSCPRYEEYHDCGSPCQVLCSNLGQECNIQNIRCPDGCYCIPGYARTSSNGPCVPQYKCPKPYCPANEVWLDCFQAPTCDRECSSLGKSCDVVGSGCNPGCFCRTGYARHPETGKCVPTSQCPAPKPECSRNEEYRSCDYRCKENCNSDYCKYEKRPCEEGCFCKSGYARVNDKCIPRSFCKSCPTHERYLECGNSCQESCKKDVSRCRTCERSGCFCEEGYSRIDGVCRPDSECPERQCPSHEVFLECGSACQDNCDQNQPCTDQCVQGCFCEPGYARINGKCVLRSSCNVCPPHEEYLECGNACIESCYEDSSRCIPCASSGCFCVDGYSRINGTCRPDSECPNRQCPAHEVFLECGSVCQDDCNPNQQCTEQCARACFCEPGYARINGVCKPRNQCSPQCPENEHFEQCGNTCTESCVKERVNCSPNCYPGCYCNKGFVRMNGKCVPEKFCKKCNLNEEYLTCGNACQDLCDASATTCLDECVEGCFCEKGFSRINGVCVPRRQCFTCGTGEEYTECGSSCLELCNRNVILCPPVCEEGCFCASGFSRVNGQCLPNELCPTCEENEEYQSCGNYCLERCGNPLCPADLPCDSGCFCKPGFKRDGKVCVPEKQCPPQCQGPNEVYSTCGNNCTDLCPDPNRFCTLECYNGCFCAEGFSRPDYNSPCIPTEQCTTCSGENEQFYECGNPCLENCPIPEICTLQCVKGCFCKPNHVRLFPGGPCVPEWQCLTQCTRPFEELSSCGNNCTELCPRPGRACNKNCWRGCFCKKGYYRAHYDGLCIPESKCPAPPVCTGPNEEVRDCSSPCDDDCPGENNECAFDCQVGCYCKPGFKRLSRGGQCVPENECSAKCTGVNEEYTDCGNPCNEDCPNSGRVCAAVCYKGCYCKPNHVRINGQCVPNSQCPKECPGQNEVYSECGNHCRDECNSEVCLTVCEVGCFCQPGFSRKDGVCVPTEECPPKCDGVNEEYTTCGSSCTEQCGVRICPAICQTGCFCKPGHSRIQGVCTPTRDCPACGENEEYTYCGSGCTDPCETRGQNCLDACREGCFCKEDHSRVTPGSPCVPDSQCTNVTCGRYEVYASCGRNCQTTCDNLGVNCPIVHIRCPDGCYCEPGYARVYEGGSCVKQEYCPYSPCGDNEVWLECGDPKQPIPCPQNCKDVGKSCQEEYPSCDMPSMGGCYCKAGFSRAPDGRKCVATSKCSSYSY
ncbi:zonadhesin-like [Phlebotomus papatasi]|uniref:zonadhesin-like n=1 Tax=Phlebotomus papatasi TaxID=29031 RepID=UPI002483EAF0|nr:zonadhesin-like [Phlebotomus papatasi]